MAVSGFRAYVQPTTIGFVSLTYEALIIGIH